MNNKDVSMTDFNYIHRRGILKSEFQRRKCHEFSYLTFHNSKKKNWTGTHERLRLAERGPYNSTRATCHHALVLGGTTLTSNLSRILLQSCAGTLSAIATTTPS
jgi:hypothetical protein